MSSSNYPPLGTSQDGIKMITISSIFYFICIVAIVTRIWSRVLQKKTLVFNDYAACMAAFFTTGLAIITITGKSCAYDSLIQIADRDYSGPVGGLWPPHNRNRPSTPKPNLPYLHYGSACMGSFKHLRQVLHSTSLYGVVSKQKIPQVLHRHNGCCWIVLYISLARNIFAMLSSSIQLG